jgi:hypothetical protein
LLQGHTTCWSSCIWGNPQGWKNQEINLNFLQVFLVSDFNGSGHEFDVISFILKCAPSLQQIDIEVADDVKLSKDMVVSHFKKYHTVNIFGKGGHPVEYY